MIHYSGYTDEEVQPVVQLLIEYIRRPVTHEAFFKKYASKKFLKGKIKQTTFAAAKVVNVSPSVHIHTPMGQKELPSQPR